MTSWFWQIFFILAGIAIIVSVTVIVPNSNKTAEKQKQERLQTEAREKEEKIKKQQEQEEEAQAQQIALELEQQKYQNRQIAQAWLDNLLTNWHIPAEHTIIVAAHCSLLNFLKAQWKSIQTFYKAPYTFIVLNDVKRHERPDRYIAIKEFCDQHQISHVTIPEELHQHRTLLFPHTTEPDSNNSCTRCADVSQVALEIFKRHSGYGILIDNDGLFIQDFSPQQVLENGRFTYAAIAQSRTAPNGQIIDYIWNMFLLFDMSKMPHHEWMNMDTGNIQGTPVDVGGYWHYYFEQTKRTNMPKYLKAIQGDQLIQTFRQKQSAYQFVECFDGLVAHLHNGGGWAPISEEQHIARSQDWLDYIDQVIANKA